MTPIRRPSLPMPTEGEIHELVTFLAANVSVAKDDGEHKKAERYQALLNTAQALAERAEIIHDLVNIASNKPLDS